MKLCILFMLGQINMNLLILVLIYLGTNDIKIETNPNKILNAAIYRDTSLKEINPSTVGNNKWLEMVDKNNAKEADQFNEAYLWTQSVLNKREL